MLETVTIEFKDREIDVNYEYIPVDPQVFKFRDGSGYPGYPAHINIVSLTKGDDNNYIKVIKRYDDMFDKGKFCKLEVWQQIERLAMEQHEKYAY